MSLSYNYCSCLLKVADTIVYKCFMNNIQDDPCGILLGNICEIQYRSDFDSFEVIFEAGNALLNHHFWF